MTVADFLRDLANPDLRFLPKALAVAVMSSIVCGVVGCHVVLRGMAFIGDAVAHAVFPGLAIAFVLQGSLVLGGAAAGIATALLVALFSQHRRIKEDAIIGVFFVGAFALGIVIISQAPGYAGSLQQFLFGSITGIPDEDLYTVGITGLVVLGVLLGLHTRLVAVSLDREMARALGLRVLLLDVLLYVAVTLAVVISLQTIGNILVLALLITPPATARLLTDRLGAMMVLAPLIGGAGATVGVYLSWSHDLPVGGTIVLVLTAVFLAAWALAPRHGLLARVRPALARALPALALVVLVVGGSSAAQAEPAGGTILTASSGDVAWSDLGPVTVAGEVELGWDLTGLDPATVRSDLVTITLVGVTGPGRITVGGASPFGEPIVLLDSAVASSTTVVQVGRSGAWRWRFDAAGTYDVDLRASAPAIAGGVVEAAASYRFEVGVAVGERQVLNATAAPTQVVERVVIDDGHVDMGPRIVDGAWRVQLKDDTTAPATWRDLADVVLHVRDGARLELPSGDAFSFLGTPGSTVHVLPQVQQPGMVWPGWNSQDPSVLAAVPGPTTWRLTGVDGPGRFVLYLAGTFGATEVLFDSGEALPQTLAIPRNTHAHGNWAFTAPGVYRLTVEMSAASGGQTVTDTRTLTIAVGDETDPTTSFTADRGGPGTPVPTTPGDPQPDRSGSQDISVESGSSRRPTGAGGGGSLATTGADHVGLLVLAGLGGIAGGAVLVGRGRRRRISIENHS